MSDEHVCKMKEKFKEIDNRINDLDRRAMSVETKLDVIIERIDGILKGMETIDCMKENMNDINAKMGVLNGKYVSKDEFVKLKMDVENLKRINEEKMQSFQRWQAILGIVLGIISLYTMIKGGTF